MAKPPAADSTAGPLPTLRVTFVYRGHDITLAASRKVRMIAPPSVTPAPDRGQSGYWLEVRAADGSLLFHRPLHNPIRVDAEVFSDDARQSIARIPIAEPQGEFEALVPDLPGAEALVLYGPPADPRLQGMPAGELIRIGFDELRKLPPDGPAGTPTHGRSQG